MAHYDRIREKLNTVAYIDKPRKHTSGKAEGSRYCYVSALYDFCESINEQIVVLCIDKLIQGDDINIKGIILRIQDCFNNKQELWNAVINVRRTAIESGKYDVHSYKDPINTDLLLDAIARHLLSYVFCSKIDEESGENHLAHIVANLIMYSYQVRNYARDNKAHKGMPQVNLQD